MLAQDQSCSVEREAGEHGADEEGEFPQMRQRNCRPQGRRVIYRHVRSFQLAAPFALCDTMRFALSRGNGGPGGRRMGSGHRIPPDPPRCVLKGAAVSPAFESGCPGRTLSEWISVADFKSIAVPPNPSTRLGQRRAAARLTDAQQVAEIRSAPIAPERPARAVRGVPAHRYAIGERLRMRNGGNILSRVASECMVISLLPYEGHGALLYRVRSDTEQFERIVSEGDLTPPGDEP